MKYLLILCCSILILSCNDASVQTENKVTADYKVKANTQQAVTKKPQQIQQKNVQQNNQQQSTAQLQEKQRKKIQEQIQQQLKARQQQQQSTTASQPAADGPEVSWVKIGKVESLVKKKPKKVIVDVYTSWCGPCKMLDKTTFRDPDVVKMMSDNFYSVKFNAEGPDPVTFKGKTYTNPRYNPAKTRGRNGQHTLTPTFGIRGYPSIIILDENMNIIDKASGYLRPNQMKTFLSKHV